MRLPVLSAGFVCGIIIGVNTNIPMMASALFLVASLSGVGLAFTMRWRLLPLLMLPFFVLGIW
ncbi:MAG: hypothetical protein QF368_10060, partial [SAR202 cluster bacterium]|nr:hypothetical protein [SAR202 cluster bacterium]